MPKYSPNEDLHTDAKGVRDAVLSDTGCHTPAALRQTVFERARRLVLGQEPTDTLDALTAEHVKAVALQPQTGTVDRLLAEGRSDDEIFELTVAAAVGAGMARLEVGLTALGRHNK